MQVETSTNDNDNDDTLNNDVEKPGLNTATTVTTVVLTQSNTNVEYILPLHNTSTISMEPEDFVNKQANIHTVTIPSSQPQTNQRTKAKSKVHNKEQSTNQPTTKSILNLSETQNTNKSRPFKHIVHATEQSLFLQWLKSFFSFLINLALLNLIVFYLIIVLPINLIKLFIFKIFQLFARTTDRFDSTRNSLKFLSPMELFWLYDTKLNKSIGTCIFFIEGNLQRTILRDLIKNRLIMATQRNGKRLYTRFTQIIAHIWGFGYAWLNTQTFDLDEHLIEISNDIKLNTDEDLQELLVKLRQKDLDYQKPLWLIYYKTNYGPDRQTLLIFIYHMCLSDGVSLMRIFLKGLVDNRLAIDVKPRFAYKNLKFNLIRESLLAWQRIFYNWLFLQSDKNLIKQEQLSGQQKICWSEPFNFVNANRLKLVTRSTMNDVLMSVLAGCMRSYLKLQGVHNPYDMHCVVAVDLRSNKYPLNLGYNSTLASVRLPTNTEGCVPRLWNIRETCTKLKRSSDYLSIYICINLLFYTLPNRLASYLTQSLFKSNTLMLSTLAAGNSSLSTVSIANRSVKNIVYLQPSTSNIALNCSIITYGDEVRLSIVCDSKAVTNPEFITNEFIRQLETLKELLSNRRIPGEVRKIIRDPIIIRASVNNIVDASEDFTIEDIQYKMSDIQHALQNLTSQFECLDRNSNEFLIEKKRMALKLDSLRRDYRNLLIKLQAKQCQETQTIPSDDEDELDPQVRVRLRSASIASRTSLNSNHRRNRSIHDDKGLRSREPSINLSAKHASVSYAAGISTLNDRTNVNRANSFVSEKSFGNLHVV